MAQATFNPRLNPVPTFQEVEGRNYVRDRDRIPTAAWNGPQAGSNLVMSVIDDLGPIAPRSPTHRVAIKVLVDTYSLDRATGTRGPDAVDVRIGSVREALPYVGRYRDLEDHRVDIFAGLFETDALTAQLALFTAGKVYGLASVEDRGSDFSLRRRDSSL